jgi:hypothetical protein
MADSSEDAHILAAAREIEGDPGRLSAAQAAATAQAKMQARKAVDLQKIGKSRYPRMFPDDSTSKESQE